MPAHDANRMIRNARLSTEEPGTPRAKAVDHALMTICTTVWATQNLAPSGWAYTSQVCSSSAGTGDAAVQGRVLEPHCFRRIARERGAYARLFLEMYSARSTGWGDGGADRERSHPERSTVPCRLVT